MSKGDEPRDLDDRVDNSLEQSLTQENEGQIEGLYLSESDRAAVNAKLPSEHLHQAYTSIYVVAFDSSESRYMCKDMTNGSWGLEGMEQWEIDVTQV
ncbi:hypothetical protein TURU_045917 [Turdus rufiventris]|nr:hypothetical protein TURU_045917 [Turdus rufiventris]